MEINTKIGILTFHTADNYGAVLQAYALQRHLQLHGYKSVEIIDFNTKEHESDYKIFNQGSKNIIKNIVLKFIVLCLYPQLKAQRNKFKEFRSRFLNITSKRYRTPDEILNNICKKDVYISGSDQVFNPYNIYKKVYYLGFDKGNSKKIAYAPSFGVSEFPTELMNPVIPLLQDFDALSCREKDGAEYLSKLFNKEIPTVCDPVFLLPKEEWIKIAKRPEFPSKYIFVYDLNGGTQLIDLAKRLRLKYELPIICATRNIKKCYHVDKQIYNVGPLDLIGYISDADYVVTDSFHGTALSLIIGTKVYPFIALEKTAGRIKSIMSILNLENQVIEGVGTNIESIEPSLEYQQNLDALVSNSSNWLLSQLKNDK